MIRLLYITALLLAGASTSFAGYIPHRNEVPFLLGSFDLELSAGLQEDAISTIHIAMALNSSHRSLWKAASLSIMDGNLYLAESILEQLEKKQPPNAEALCKSGRLQLYLRNEAAAKELFQKALKLSPQHAEALLFLAIIDLKKQKEFTHLLSIRAPDKKHYIELLQCLTMEQPYIANNLSDDCYNLLFVYISSCGTEPSLTQLEYLHADLCSSLKGLPETNRDDTPPSIHSKHFISTENIAKKLCYDGEITDKDLAPVLEAMEQTPFFKDRISIDNCLRPLASATYAPIAPNSAYGTREHQADQLAQIGYLMLSMENIERAAYYFNEALSISSRNEAATWGLTCTALASQNWIAAQQFYLKLMTNPHFQLDAMIQSYPKTGKYAEIECIEEISDGRFKPLNAVALSFERDEALVDHRLKLLSHWVNTGEAKWILNLETIQKQQLEARRQKAKIDQLKKIMTAKQNANQQISPTINKSFSLRQFEDGLNQLKN